jgi:DNA-binding NtrC family response regulator
MKKDNIILIEDDEPLSKLMASFLADEKSNIIRCSNARDGLENIREHTPALAILDLGLPDMDGLEVLKELKREALPTEVIIITGHGSIDIVVEAMSLGAIDFIEKPFESERLLVSVRNALERYRLVKIIDEYDDLYKSQFFDFIGRSPGMQSVYRIIENAASSKATIMILGESGTGKELCAKAIHKSSPRINSEFVPINCAAIPADLVESEIFGHVKGAFTGASKDRKGAVSMAEGGTLFLDEIGEMSLDTQAKFLRFLQSGQFQRVGSSSIEHVDVRIVCATNKDPMDLLKDGRFREDLYYRLNVIPISLPPLRERDDDAVLIARSLLTDITKEEGKSFQDFSTEAESIIRNHSWPGNVRELQNVIRNVVVLNRGKIVTPDMLPESMSTQVTNLKEAYSGQTIPIDNTQVINNSDVSNTPAFRSLLEIEQNAICEAIKLCDDNIPKAAALLGVSPSTIYRKKQAWEDKDKDK